MLPPSLKTFEPKTFGETFNELPSRPSGNRFVSHRLAAVRVRGLTIVRERSRGQKNTRTQETRRHSGPRRGAFGARDEYGVIITRPYRLPCRAPNIHSTKEPVGEPPRPIKMRSVASSARHARNPPPQNGHTCPAERPRPRHNRFVVARTTIRPYDIVIISCTRRRYYDDRY